MSISFSGQYNEVDSNNYVSSSLSVSTTQVQAKVGSSNLEGRQNVLIYNKSSVTVYIGPSGVTSSTGIPIYADSFFSYSFGQDINVFMITALGTATVIVQEMA